MDDTRTIGFRKRHLPHWTVADHSYFVTIRLKGSIPVEVARKLECERTALMELHPIDEEREALQRKHFYCIENILDSSGVGPRHLGVASVAEIVFKSFDWLESKKGWLVHALSIMPNHVHVVLRNTIGRNDQLNKDLGILKGFTARECNRVLNQTGSAFWMDENFDHWIRDDKRLLGAVCYTAMNPIKAALATHWNDWPWTRVGEMFMSAIDDCDGKKLVSQEWLTYK
jgi:REP element-mobilizing transposase RayT